MVDGFSATAALHHEAFVANPDAEAIAFVGPILTRCPLLTPEADVLPLVVFTSFLAIKPIWPHGTGRDDNMDVWIIFCWILLVVALVDCCNCAQPMLQKVYLNKLPDDPDEFSMWKLIGEGAFEFPRSSSIISALCPLNGVAEVLKVVKFRWGIGRLKDVAIEYVLPPLIIVFVSIRVVQSSSADIVCQTGNRAVFAATDSLYF